MAEKQSTFDEWMTKNPRLAGSNYDHERDGPRLLGQIRRVYDFMADGKWHTLEAISRATGDPHASVSAQLRHIRNKVGRAVEKHYLGNGLYEYRMDTKNGQKPAAALKKVSRAPNS